MGYAIVVFAALAWVASYAIACAYWPFAKCSKCDGHGKKRSPSGRAFRTCKRCKGTGRRLRTGRVIFNKLHVLGQDGIR